MNLYFWFMKNFVDRPNTWYDHLREPLRFMIFISTLMLTLLLTTAWPIVTLGILGLLCLWRIFYFRY